MPHIHETIQLGSTDTPVDVHYIVSGDGVELISVCMEGTFIQVPWDTINEREQEWLLSQVDTHAKGEGDH